MISQALHLSARQSDDGYTQSIAVEYASPEDANAATAKILQFPENKKIAFSTRWDDTNTGHLLTAKMLGERGMFASCFLVGSFDEKQTKVFKQILDMGGAMGAHCLTHPHLEMLTPNNIFREVALERVLVETAFDKSSIAFVLPYMTYSSPFDKNVRGYIARSIINAGFRFCPETGMNFFKRYGVKTNDVYSSCTFGVNDRDPQRDLMQKGIEKALARISKGEEPHITLGIHSWQNAAARKKLGELIDEVKSDDFWYCNANDYVAYRAHFLKSKILKFAVKGNVAIFELRRISAADVGSDIPISIEFSNSPKSVKVGDKLVTPKNGIYNIEHYADKKCPKKIDSIRFDNSKFKPSKKFDGLKFAFTFNRDAGKLSLKIGGDSVKRVTNFRARWVVPPCYKVPMDGLLFSDSTKLSANLKPRLKEGSEVEMEAFATGDMLVMARCDFLFDGEPSRVWLIVEDKRPNADVPCARDNALHLGDFDAKLNDPDFFAKMSKPDAILEPFADMQWIKKPVTNFREFVVNFNGFKVMKKYAEKKMSYLICADFDAPRDDKFDLCVSSRFVKEACLNGKKIDNLKSRMEVEMAKGKNRVLIVLNQEATRANGVIFSVRDGDKFLECTTPKTK